VGPPGHQLIVTHFELLFFESEAAFRLGDLERAASALNEAIKKQIDLVTPAAYSHVAQIPSIDYQSMIENYIETNANETASTVTIEKIMTQKYVAMFTMNTESWNDVRRYDYNLPPFLSIPKTPDGTPIGTGFIQRVLYPQESVNTNKNTPNSDLFTKLWIFTK